MSYNLDDTFKLNVESQRGNVQSCALKSILSFKKCLGNPPTQVFFQCVPLISTSTPLQLPSLGTSVRSHIFLYNTVLWSRCNLVSKSSVFSWQKIRATIFAFNGSGRQVVSLGKHLFALPLHLPPSPFPLPPAPTTHSNFKSNMTGWINNGKLVRFASTNKTPARRLLQHFCLWIFHTTSLQKLT